MPDRSVPGIINGHKTPPGVEADNLDIVIMATEGVPDPGIPGIRNGHKTPPVTNPDHLGIITTREKGCQTGAFRVS